MKINCLLFLSFIFASASSAQLAITPGAEFTISGNMQLTLQDFGLINNGRFNAGNSKVSFIGNTSSLISGSQPLQFHELEMNKTNNSSILLQRAINVGQRILFSSGFLDLNGFDIELGNTGSLDGEKENSRVIGSGGGEILSRANLNSPAESNPGNLGCLISSNQNLGSVTIKRGHRLQAGVGLVSSIFRYYDIIADNNTNVNATIRMNYLNGELNNFDESEISFFSSQDNNIWPSLLFSTRDTVANFVERLGINSFGRFTLSDDGVVLPVRFTLFNAKCDRNKVLVTWKTAQEQNSSHFNIEGSADGLRWTVIGSAQAAGNTNSEFSYSFTVNNPSQYSYYRIAEYDLDGRIQYTPVLRSPCNALETFSLWPNPVHDILNINIIAANESLVILNVFDSKGALVKTQRENALQGSNQLSLDMSSLPKGIYSLSAEWNNGRMKKGVQVLKR